MAKTNFAKGADSVAAAPKATIDMSVRAERPSAWSAPRTVSLVALLAIVLAVLISLMITLCAFIGWLVAEAGLLTQDQLLSTGLIVGVIILGSVVLSIFLSALINGSLVRPMRLMTMAVQELAKGNFSVRMTGNPRGQLKEVDDFIEGFNKAAQELEGTETMRANFISDFSHEFRTPINTLSGFAQVLRSDDLTPEERDEYLQIIIDESWRLAGLSERILLLSKLEAATILPDAAPVDLSEQIKRAALMAEPQCAERNIAIEISDDNCWAQGNADYLVQLWTNLLDNAIKFSPDNSTVSIALMGTRPTSDKHTPEDRFVTCWISDEGCGMDAATRERIFDKFYQGESSHASEGSGLGLSLCKRIVELHGGTIEVNSAPDAGTTFEVRLPAGK